MKRDFTTRVFGAALEHKRLWLIQLAGNAVLIVAAYGWLWIPDESAVQLVLSSLLLLAVVLAALVLHGGTLAAFVFAQEKREARLGEAFRAALRHWLPLLLWSAVLALLIYYVLRAQQNTAAGMGYLHTKFPVWLRARTDPEKLWEAADWLLGVFACGVLPLVMLPLAAGLAADGFRARLSQARRALAVWQYWVAGALLWMVGAYVPGRLVWWVRPLKSMNAEMASLVARFGVAYLLAITAWVLLASAVAAARVDTKES
jgi:hypothetical protein